MLDVAVTYGRRCPTAHRRVSPDSAGLVASAARPSRFACATGTNDGCLAYIRQPFQRSVDLRESRAFTTPSPIIGICTPQSSPSIGRGTVRIPSIRL
jgi:hypothetical protein